MKVLLTGSSGLVGGALKKSLVDIEWVSLVRDSKKSHDPDVFTWDPAHGRIDPKAFAGVHAVVHLAGESIASGRWTPAKKGKIRESRVQGTRFLVGGISSLPTPPPVFISASAIGFYGDRREKILTEDSSSGNDFLASTCVEWEKASFPLVQKGVRVVHLRFGIILSPEGGALAKMLFPFKWGMGGKLGSGSQYMSWVALQDVVRMIRFSLENESVQGPVNGTAPNPVTNKEFTRILGRVLHRPTLLPAPEWGLRILLGEMADALLLSGARVQPKKLTDAGFSFQFPDLEPALRSML